MKATPITLILCLILCPDATAITNGKVSQYPHVPALKTNTGRCSGSRISDRLILTNAHCVDDGSPDSFRLTLDSSEYSTKNGLLWVTDKKGRSTSTTDLALFYITNRPARSKLNSSAKIGFPKFPSANFCKIPSTRNVTIYGRGEHFTYKNDRFRKISDAGNEVRSISAQITLSSNNSIQKTILIFSHGSISRAKVATNSGDSGGPWLGKDNGQSIFRGIHRFGHSLEALKTEKVWESNGINFCNDEVREQLCRLFTSAREMLLNFIKDRHLEKRGSHAIAQIRVDKEIPYPKELKCIFEQTDTLGPKPKNAIKTNKT